MSRRVSSNTFILSPLDVAKTPLSLVNQSADECHLYTSIPFRDKHALTVHISIVPFSLERYGKQIFYYADASYAECCHSVDRNEYLPLLIGSVQNLYHHHVAHHCWDFDDPDSWRQFQIPDNILQRKDTCPITSLCFIEHLITESDLKCYTETCSRHLQPGVYLVPKEEQETSPNSSSQPPLPWTLIETPINHSAASTECSTETTKLQMRKTQVIESIADSFLRALSTVKLSSSTIDPHRYLLNKYAYEKNDNEPAIKAFNCCTLVLRQANEQLKHGRFTRFVSLLFFLIWEYFACKNGKAGARLVNAKMKEAGLGGSSRSLKALRDETIFINRLIASVESMYDIGLASLVLYHIFDASNYHLIRLLNRYSSVRKTSAITRICENLGTPATVAPALPTLRIHDIIKQYMPKLNNNEINIAIGYQGITRLGNGEPVKA